MPCTECPETPDTGCLHPITTECVTYNGNDIDCAEIVAGQNLNQIIEQLARKCNRNKFIFRRCFGK
jgi:hypothetical protein